MHKIAVVPGDGTGTEVVNEGLKVLEAVAQKKSLGLRLPCLGTLKGADECD